MAKCMECLDGDMEPEQQHHIRNAVLCLKYLLGVGDIPRALEQVRRIDMVMNVIDLNEAKARLREDAAQSEAVVFGWMVYGYLESVIDEVPPAILLRIMTLCRRALQDREAD